jgi:hypothetical protein
MMQAGVRVSVTCTATAVTSIRRDEPLPQGATTQGELLDMADFRPTPSGRLKTFTSLGGVTLRALAPKWALNPIRARAEAPQGHVIVTKTGGSTDGSWGSIGVRPTFEWCVLLPRDVTLSSDPTEIKGMLVAFLPTGGDIAANVRKVAQSCTPADLDRVRSIYSKPSPATSSGEPTPPPSEVHTSGVPPRPPGPSGLPGAAGPPAPPRSGPPPGPPPRIQPPRPN